MRGLDHHVAAAVEVEVLDVGIARRERRQRRRRDAQLPPGFPSEVTEPPTSSTPTGVPDSTTGGRHVAGEEGVDVAGESGEVLHAGGDEVLEDLLALGARIRPMSRGWRSVRATVCSDISITSLPQSFQVAFDLATALLNHSFWAAPSIVRPGVVVVGAALEHARRCTAAGRGTGAGR